MKHKDFWDESRKEVSFKLRSVAEHRKKSWKDKPRPADQWWRF